MQRVDFYFDMVLNSTSACVFVTLVLSADYLDACSRVSVPNMVCLRFDWWRGRPIHLRTGSLANLQNGNR